MKNLLKCLARDESGVTAIEYGLITSLISVVVIGAMTAVGTSLNVVYATIATAVTAAL
jgi:pilus assembly protein Flp/PilA